MSCSSAGRPHVLDARRRQRQVRRDARGVDGHAIRVMLGVFVLRDEVPQQHQHAVVGFAQLVELRGRVLVQRAHQVAGDDQDAAPGRQVEPRRHRRRGARAGPAEEIRRGREERDHQHAGERRQRGVAPAVQVRRAERRQRVEAEHHALRVQDEVQDQRDDEHRKNEPQFLVHSFEVTQNAARGCGGRTLG